MATAISLNIGLNSVDPQHYGGWSGKLNACEADADDMAAIAKAQKMKPMKRLTKQATRARVKRDISEAAKKLKKGDLFFLSYSGHGGQLPDLSDDEPDAQDETWCLYDGELIDDELYVMLGKFAKGVRIFVLSDSCHSGSVVKLAYYRGTPLEPKATTASEGTKYRFMPSGVALRTYRQNKGFYDKLLKDPALKKAQEVVKASVLLISGCQDNQLSADGDFNGLFTANLLRVWDEGRFNAGKRKRSYRSFHEAIVNQMPPDQTPNYFTAGASSAAFEAQRPFML
jgi:hypothetical protein